MKSMPKIEDVAQYWGRAPLLSHEIATPGSDVYFHRLNEAKVTDSDRFPFAYWDFDGFAGKKVLDIGCGPGWVTVQYAQGGATVSSVDLTGRAVDLAKQHCALRGVQAKIRQGNAESLPFDDRVFDLVVASGVLHHTPDVQKAFSEAFRVTRAGGRGKITLYRKGIAHHPFIFGLTHRITSPMAIRSSMPFMCLHTIRSAPGCRRQRPVMTNGPVISAAATVFMCHILPATDHGLSVLISGVKV